MGLQTEERCSKSDSKYLSIFRRTASDATRLRASETTSFCMMLKVVGIPELKTSQTALCQIVGCHFYCIVCRAGTFLSHSRTLPIIERSYSNLDTECTALVEPVAEHSSEIKHTYIIRKRQTIAFLIAIFRSHTFTFLTLSTWKHTTQEIFLLFLKGSYLRLG